MPSGKWFRIGYGIIIVLIIIYLSSLVDFLFNPIRTVLGAIFVPILISGILYYMMRPVVRLLNRWIPQIFSILIVYVLAIWVLLIAVALIWTPVQEQSMALVANFPSIVRELSNWLQMLEGQEWLSAIDKNQQFSLDNITSQITSKLGEILNSIVGSISGMISMATSFFLLIALTPFIVYYMLKDGHKFPERILSWIPERRKHEARLTLQEIDASIGGFILSKLITAAILGVLVYIGYLIIDLPYPVVMAMIAAILNIIPYLGPFLAGVPTAIVALSVSPVAPLYVILILVIANQIEGNLIGPKVMGKQLNIHPLTIILLVIGAGEILGPLGMVIVVPIYAIIKIIVIRIYKFYRESNKVQPEQAEQSEQSEQIEPAKVD